ncbi:hypothetical protein [Caulobacter sp. 17J80-11]|uniref:hypothetical protein n=1 Tax=Caulobacter sp. 17J80-11 TaxID=2763502 RepID=UPI001653DA8A|nr:hypothetical protein [Caulobacter sp. 17J80-11]MBC6980324.1 hypothetical protein [Caulobacter sp. 17J80-11]
MQLTPQSRIEHELEELTPVSLADLRERACAAVFPDIYALDDEGEEAPEPMLAKVRSAKSAARIFDLLGVDAFEAY